MTPQNEPISALDCAITPQSTGCVRMALIGSHKRRSPRLGRNHSSRSVPGPTKPNKTRSITKRKPKKASGSAR